MRVVIDAWVHGAGGDRPHYSGRAGLPLPPTGPAAAAADMGLTYTHNEYIYDAYK